MMLMMMMMMMMMHSHLGVMHCLKQHDGTTDNAERRDSLQQSTDTTRRNQNGRRRQVRQPIVSRTSAAAAAAAAAAAFGQEAAVLKHSTQQHAVMTINTIALGEPAMQAGLRQLMPGCSRHLFMHACMS